MCARCMLYHCMSDSEGDLINHPCSCSSNAAEEVSCTKRWIGLALLSLLVPCLWCYPPLKACHMIGIQCGVCGGKHKPPIWQPIKIYHHPDAEPLRKNQKAKQQARVHFQQPNLYDHRNFYHSAINNYQHLQPATTQTGFNKDNCNFFWMQQSQTQENFSTTPRMMITDKKSWNSQKNPTRKNILKKKKVARHL
jgi:Sprouty protein (Spry)